MNAKRNPIFSQSRNAQNAVDRIQLPMVCQDQRDQQIQNMDVNDWRTKIKMSENHNANLDKFLIRLSELQHMWDGHLARIKVGKH